MKEINESKEIADYSNPASIRRNSVRKDKDDHKIALPPLKITPNDLDVHSMNLSIPIHHIDNSSKSRSVSPRNSARRKMSKIFNDSVSVKKSLNLHEKL
jgi:hypothetical protein